MFGVQLVRGRPFYGFCEDDRVFVKITLYNPRDVSKVAALLQASVRRPLLPSANKQHVHSCSISDRSCAMFSWAPDNRRFKLLMKRFSGRVY